MFLYEQSKNLSEYENYMMKKYGENNYEKWNGRHISVNNFKDLCGFYIVMSNIEIKYTDYCKLLRCRKYVNLELSKLQ